MLLGVGLAMLVAQVAGAIALAPVTTGEGDANAGVLAGMWIASIAWSTATVLLLIRHADLPDIATASFLVSVSTFAAFALTAALNSRGTDTEVNAVDALFLGVTSGAMTALVVWLLAMMIARLLRLPTTQRDDERPEG